MDVLDYCSAHPKALLPKEDNCGQYFNCSDSGFDSNHTMECKYPDLFSVKTMSCQWFENATCDNRMEPQAPCKIVINIVLFRRVFLCFFFLHDKLYFYIIKVNIYKTFVKHLIRIVNNVQKDCLPVLENLMVQICSHYACSNQIILFVTTTEPWQ